MLEVEGTIEPFEYASTSPIAVDKGKAKKFEGCHVQEKIGCDVSCSYFVLLYSQMGLRTFYFVLFYSQMGLKPCYVEPCTLNVDGRVFLGGVFLSRLMCFLTHLKEQILPKTKRIAPVPKHITPPRHERSKP